MKIFFDFLSIILFYLAYQFYEYVPEGVIQSINSWIHLGLKQGEQNNAIYFAILVGIVAAGLQALYHWVLDGNPSKTHMITFFAFLIFGGITLYLHNPVFIKWKPTIVNAVIAVIFLGSTVIGNKPLVERMMGRSIQASTRIWHRLTLGWAIFFAFIAILNIFVAYNLSESVWVNFKLFGILGLTIGFLVIQTIYLSKHSHNKE